MKTRFRGMTGRVMRLVPAGVMGLGPRRLRRAPDIVPIAPPGAEVPRKVPR